MLRFILACSFTLILLGGCSRGKSQEAAPQASTEQAVTITTRPVETREVKRTVEMVGTLSGWEEVTVSNETAGTIEKILVDLGDKVKRGQLLIRLDQREARLSLAQAEANLQAAKKALAQAQAEWRDADLSLKRIQQLHSEGVIATSQLDVAQARFDSIEAQVHAREADIDRFQALVDLARKHLSDTEIVAPISSEVQQRLVSIGEGVKEKTPRLRVRGVFLKLLENPQRLFSSFLRGASCLKSPRHLCQKRERLYLTTKRCCQMQLRSVRFADCPASVIKTVETCHLLTNT